MTPALFNSLILSQNDGSLLCRFMIDRIPLGHCLSVSGLTRNCKSLFQPWKVGGGICLFFRGVGDDKRKAYHLYILGGCVFKMQHFRFSFNLKCFIHLLVCMTGHLSPFYLSTVDNHYCKTKQSFNWMVLHYLWHIGGLSHLLALTGISLHIHSL